MFKHSVFINATALFFMQLLGYISPLLVYPYLTRVLGISGFGQYAMAISITALSFIITDFGFALSGANWLAKNRNKTKEVKHYLSNVCLLKFIFFALCSVISSLVIITSQQLSYLLHSIPAIIFLLFSQTFQMNWLFQGLEKMSLAIYPFVISRIIFILTVFIFVKYKADVNIAIFLLGFSNLLSVIISACLLAREGLSFCKPSFRDSFNILKNNISFFLSRASVSIYTSASAFILGYTTNVHAVAYYSAAEKLYTAGQSLTGTVSQALYPYLSRTGNKNIFNIALIIVMLPLTIGIGIAFIFSSELINLIYGTAYSESIPILKIFLICLIINFIGVSYGYPAFAIINRIDVANKTVYMGGIFQISSLLYLYVNDIISANSVAISVLMTETFVMCLRILFYYIFSKNAHD